MDHPTDTMKRVVPESDVTQGADGPSYRHDEAHVRERLLHRFGSVVSVDLGCLTLEDLSQDVKPTAHAANETGPGMNGLDLAEVAECQHDNGADHQTPEHAATELGACSLRRGLEDQIELDHLEGHGNGPIDVTVDDGGSMNQHPEFTHVEIMNTGDLNDALLIITN